MEKSGSIAGMNAYAAVCAGIGRYESWVWAYMVTGDVLKAAKSNDFK